MDRVCVLVYFSMFSMSLLCVFLHLLRCVCVCVWVFGVRVVRRFCILLITSFYELVVWCLLHLACVILCVLRMVCVSFLCSSQYLFYGLAVCVFLISCV